MALRLAYMVPEFPTQTHIFLWREILILKKKGIDLKLVSTRKPLTSLVPNPWGASAIEKTMYMMPLSHHISTICLLHVVSFRGLGRIIRMFFTARDLSMRDRIKFWPLVILGYCLGARSKRLGVNHIHSHFNFNGADIVMFASLLFDIPYSMSRHGNSCGIGNQKAKWDNAKFGIVVTQIMKQELRKEYPELKTPVFVVALGVDSDKFKRKIPYSPFEGVGCLKIFSCGRLNPAKGPQDLIRVIDNLLKRNVDCHLTIAGNDEQGGAGFKLELEGMIEQLGLRKRVLLVGSLCEDQVVSQLEEAHLFALATHDEAIGVAFMEAMSMELPVVGTRVGGVPELITHGVDGILVGSKNIDEMVAAILDLVQDPRKAVSLGQEARKKIMEKFQSTNSAEALLTGIQVE